jgi:glucose-1-phosphate adenylyltransferase
MFVILSGDHLYRMDYRKFVERHRETGADITLSVVPMDEKRASDFGLMKIDASGRVVDFCEKPKGDALAAMQVDTTILGLNAEEAKASPYIASMGIYVFKKDALIKLLRQNPDYTDFGKEIIPNAAKENNIQAYLFKGYWEDIGTIESFYDANLALTRQPHPPFSFYEEDAPIYTRHRFLPPSKFLDAQVTESIVGEGCILKKCRVHHSVLGVRSRIEAGCVIEDSLLMGADYYQNAAEKSNDCYNKEYVPIGIGANTTIRRAIIDKNAHIGCDVQIVNKDRIEDADRENLGFIIRNGIVVVVKNAIIPDGMII